MTSALPQRDPFLDDDEHEGPFEPEDDERGALPERWWGGHLSETRWMLETWRLAMDPVWVGATIPYGDGRAVILAPGFGAGDQTLMVLASWLWRIGYRPWLCGFVTNTDCGDRALDRVERRVLAAHRRSGRRVAVLGHSRGGHYARAIAARHPDKVSHAISLGAGLESMLDCSLPTVAAVTGAQKLLQLSGRGRAPQCLTETCECPFNRDFRRPFPEDRVRLTSIYSRGDGVVRWTAQRVPYAECVEVTGSHVGLVFNRKSYRAIAHALAEPER